MTKKNQKDAEKAGGGIEMEFVKQYGCQMVLLVFNVGSSITSFANGDWRHGVYFLASGVCIAMMTW